MRDDLLGDVEMIGEGGNFYILINGIRIAKRENCQWTSLVPGYSAEDLDGGESIAVDVDCSKLPLRHREAIQHRARIARWAPRLKGTINGTLRSDTGRGLTDGGGGFLLGMLLGGLPMRGNIAGRDCVPKVAAATCYRPADGR